MEATESITVPFTYRIICPNGLHYYGVRYAVGCNPKDLWTTYFTSSKEIKKLLQSYDRTEFIVEVRKCFLDTESAIQYERRVLERVVGKPGWLNKHIGGEKFVNAKPPSEETRQKISNSLKGFKHSEETIRKRVLKLTGKKKSEESKKKASESNKGKHVISEETRQKLIEAWNRRRKV